MPESKDDILSDFHDFSELYEHLAILHDKTQKLCNEIFDDGIESVKLVDLRLAEIYSLYNSAKVYLSLKTDLHHYKLSTLLSFWNDAYFQIYRVACESDQNTSWMYSKVQNYFEQYDIVERMIKTKIQELKELSQ
ncbi:hypothetical protein HXZ66_15765 [Bacillus sp. A116_S68]|jgi:hypothetical protein|nr:hypothetical protein HXZ66_15765 [Bacillus sp. A116_S68]